MQNRTSMGILYLCMGVLVFSVQDAIIKEVSGDYPLTEVVGLRSFVALPILSAIVYFDTGLGAIVSRNFWALVFRSIIMFVGYMAYYMAFPALPLADAVALYFTVPLFVVALAVPVLGERAGWRGLLAVIIGFGGVLIMLRPGSGLFEPAALLSLFAAAAYALSMLLARKIGAKEASSVIAFYQNAVFLVGAFVVAAAVQLSGVRKASHPSIDFLVRPWLWPTVEHALLIVVCGIVAAAGISLLVNAYRVASASQVAPFEYTGMLWAPMWGYLLFSEIPHVMTFIGAGLIVAAGLFVLLGGRNARPEELPAE